MSLVAFCAGKGSPGVTTSALALARAWPRPAVLAELDPSGGDLALRLTDGAGHHALAPRPGLLTWAAAGMSPNPPVSDHVQLAGAVTVLAGCAGADQATVLAPLWPRLATQLSGAPPDVLADLGRLFPGSAVEPVLAAADLVVVVAAGSVEGLVHARDRLRALHGGGHGSDGRLALLLLTGDRAGRHVAGEAAIVLSRDRIPATVVGFLADDPRGVEALVRGDRSARWARSLLARTATAVAATLIALSDAATPSTEDTAAVVRR